MAWRRKRRRPLLKMSGRLQQVMDQGTGLIEVVGADGMAVREAQVMIQRLLEEAKEGMVYRCAHTLTYAAQPHPVPCFHVFICHAVKPSTWLGGEDPPQHVGRDVPRGYQRPRTFQLPGTKTPHHGSHTASNCCTGRAEPRLGAGRGARVASVEKFGVIAEFLPGKEGLVHISELDIVRTGNLSNWAAGDSIDVMLLEARPPPAATGVHDAGAALFAPTKTCLRAACSTSWCKHDVSAAAGRDACFRLRSSITSEQVRPEFLRNSVLQHVLGLVS